MSTETELPAVSPVLQNTHRVPIAQLNPNASESDEYHIDASVALIWPYSSSTGRLSLLLAEKDIRLRKSKGQIRVTFHGDCAQEVARTHVGIGDSVKLGLRHATWTKTGEEVSTPGKKLEWDIDIYKYVLLEVARGEDNTATVNFAAKSPPPTVSQNSVVEIAGPATNGFIDIRKTRLSDFRSSPVHRSNRVSSGSYIDASLDPFADDDGFIAGRGRKRTKFARHSGSWQLLDVDDQASIEREDFALPEASQQQINGESVPQESRVIEVEENRSEMEQLESTPKDSHIPNVPVQVEESVLVEAQPSSPPLDEVEDQAIDQRASSSSSASPQFSSPTKLQPQTIPSINLFETPKMIKTPVLRPLLSPGLPLVSPLVERSVMATSYFPIPTNARPMLDVASQLVTQSQDTIGSHCITAPSSTEDSHVEVNSTGKGNPDLHIEDQASTPLGNDPIHTEQALQTDIEDTTSDILPTVVLGQGIASTPRHGYSEENATASINLDALEQHIEESNHHYHESSSASQSEDEDMYGPPVNARTKTVAVDAVDKEKDLDNSPDASSSIRLRSESLPGSIGPLNAPEEQQIPQHRALDSEDEDDLQIAEIEVIQEKEEEEEEDVDRDGISEDEEYVEDNSTESSDESQSPDNSRYLSVRTELTAVVPVAAVSETLHHENHSPSSPVLVDEETMQDLAVASSEAPHQLLETQNIAKFDGMDEIYEDEDQREHLRTIKRLPIIPAEFQTVSMSSGSSDIDSSLAVDSESLLGPGAEMDVNSEEGRPPGVFEIAEHHDRDSSEVINEHIDQELEDIAPAPSTLAKSTQHPSLPEQQTGSLQYVITPEATQQTSLLVDATTPVPIGPQAAFPLTPQMTQDATNQTRETSSRVIYSPDVEFKTKPEHEDGAEPVLPKMASEKTSPPRRFSQRLTRKSFSPERISTEYFTPRRSMRVAQSSPTFAKDIPVMSQPLTSPPLSKRVLRSSSPTIVQQKGNLSALSPRLTHGISTPLSYYPYLANLQQYFDLQVDAIAVCTADSSSVSKSQSGPKDHYTTLFLADASFAESDNVIKAQLFRPKKAALPVARRGDVILLRNMKVQTHQHDMLLLSTESSAWAVFKQFSGRVFDVATNGPPVEYGDHEKAEANKLLEWWTDSGSAKYPELTAVAGAGRGLRDTRSTSPMMTRSQKRRAQTVEDSEDMREEEGHAKDQGGELTSFVRDSSNQPDASEVPSTPESVNTHNVFTREAASPTIPTKRNGHRRTNSKRSESVIHELRDGFKWIDDDGRQRSPSIHQLRDGSTYIDE